MKPLTFDELQRILERYVRHYSARDPQGVWCIADAEPHLARSVHVTGTGWVACWQHIRQEANR